MASHNRLEKLKQYTDRQGWSWQRGKAIQHGEQVIISDGTARISVNFYPRRDRLVLGGPETPLKAHLASWMEGPGAPDAGATPAAPVATGTTPLDQLKDWLQARGWNWGPGAAIPYGEQLVVSDGQSIALVNFWPKRGTLQVQGQPSPLKVALDDWVRESRSVPDVAGSQTHTALALPHIGADESGKGDWFGPLVVAAVYVDEAAAVRLQRAGVRDSKLLDRAQLQCYAVQIEQVLPAEWRCVVNLWPEPYNALYAQHGNINLVLSELYAQAAEAVYRATGAETIVCDQFSQRADRLERAFATRNLPRPHQQHHAEQASIAVASASILASVTFAATLADLGQQAGWELPLPAGSSAVADLEAAARQIIAQQGTAALGRYAKLNFKPVQALLSDAG